MIATAFEPDDTTPVWLLTLPGEWQGPWDDLFLETTLGARRGPLLDLHTPYGIVSIAQTAEHAIRAKGAQLVLAAHPPIKGPRLTILWPY